MENPPEEIEAEELEKATGEGYGESYEEGYRKDHREEAQGV